RFRVLPLSSALHRSSACLLSVISPSGVCKLPRSACEKRPKPSPSWRTPSAMTPKRHLAGHSSANSRYPLLDGESKDDRTRSWIRDYATSVRFSHKALLTLSRRSPCRRGGAAQVLTNLFVHGLQHFFGRGRFVSIVLPPDERKILVHLMSPTVAC